MIEEQVVALEMGEVVELYTIDLTKFGDVIYYWTTSKYMNDEPLMYRNQLYVPMDIEATGFEHNSRGTLPQPTFKVANTSRALTGLVVSYSDFIGAEITRLRTLKKYLDGQPEANIHAHFPIEKYLVEQKTTHNKLFLEFKLSIAIDVEGQMLPRRVMSKTFCTHIYRRWDQAEKEFDYTKATCPYTNPVYFDITGKQVLAARNDKCSKRMTSGCRKRFGNGTLPMQAFPGLGGVT